jgi:hypothetical protein
VPASPGIEIAPELSHNTGVERLSARVRLICAVAVLSAAGLAIPSGADDPERILHAVLQQADAGLASITSDAEARELFSSRLLPMLGLTHGKELTRLLSGAAQAGLAPTTSSDPAAAATRLTTELAAWRLARLLTAAWDTPDRRQAVPAVSATQRRWLLADHDVLRRALSLSETLAALGERRDEAGSLDPVYAGHLDRTVPQTGPDSWADLAEREGAEGVRLRLRDAWDQTKGASPEPGERERQAAQYVATRVRPVLAAQALAAAIRAEGLAASRSSTAWMTLQAWNESVKSKKAAARLCGTWQWVVHNHKNHQEHKTMMRLDPEASSGEPRPAKIVVLGDVVYLRWEFQGGFQEDSLLFTGGGQRLEGTFVNSAGAWGSISGKRVAGCSG